MIPDGVAGTDHRDLVPVSVPDPERLAGAGFVSIILENQDRQQAVGLAGEDIVSLQGIG